jgi:hypothetical protein
MAIVHQVHDGVLGRTSRQAAIAVREASDPRFATAMFEREFHTLSSLAHPSIIGFTTTESTRRAY